MHFSPLLTEISPATRESFLTKVYTFKKKEHFLKTRSFDLKKKEKKPQTLDKHTFHWDVLYQKCLANHYKSPYVYL